MRLPRQIYPSMVEAEYARAIVGLLDSARAAIAPLRAELASLVDARTDALWRTDVDRGKRARDLVDRARQKMVDAVAPDKVEAIARSFGKRTDRQNRAQLGKQVKAALGVDLHVKDKKLARLMADFVHENVALIKTIPSDFHDEVEQLVTRGLSDGALHGDIAKQIDDRYDVGASRARRIARDQVGKLYGKINRARIQELGVKKFIWRDVGDERVRPEHRALEEQSEREPFSYDDPPTNDDGEVILPGIEPECRCTDEPVFASIDDEDDDQDSGEDDD